MEKSLNNCLDITKAPELPDQWDGKSLWIRAIVLVKKADGTRNYCTAISADGRDVDTIVRDFGAASIITNIESIHPYEYQTQKNERNTKAIRSKAKA